MEDNSVLNDEVKVWLKSGLSNENFQDFSVNILGATEKGDGYVGDILFVDATGIGKEGATKEYNLVLKCSKRSAVLREQAPVKIIFLNEIYVYEIIFPAFTKFQLEKNIEKPFDSVPKLYGSFVDDNMEVLILQNLKKIGYELWERRTPLNLQHSLAVVKEYGRYHAISVAFQDQKPKEFEEIVGGIRNVMEGFMKTMDFVKFHADNVSYIIESMKADLDVKLADGWRRLIDKIGFIFGDLMFNNSNRLNVVTHGDCWNNNFMYSYDDDKNIPAKIAFLDWQVTRYGTPIMDLSYFLFTTSSEESFANFDTLLKEYHSSLSNYLCELGSDPELYPFDQFMDEWRKYSAFGLLTSNLIMRICLTEKDEVINIEEAVENAEKMTDALKNEIKNSDEFKRRMKCIIQYAVENNLV